YSQRIASMWFEPTPGLPKGLPLAQLETTDVGRPYHLLSGAVHTRRQHDGTTDGPNRDQFLFSKLYCGSESTGYSQTSNYMNGECTLEDAVAISGAAVSPVQTDNPLIIALLFLTNIRLGQWVPNPGYMSALSRRLQRALVTAPYTPLRFLIDKLHCPEKRSFCFVTDGGHYENLGIEPLLKRRCRLIIASDAGQDGKSEFADLTNLIRNIKRVDGISIVMLGGMEMTRELEKLLPSPETRLAREHFLNATIRYPDGTSGTLIYFKPTLNGDEPFELRQFHRTHDEFPHDPTSDQFYDADRFDSYRALGLHIASQVCASMEPIRRGACANLNSEQFIEQCLSEFPVSPPAQEATSDIDERPLCQQVRQLLEELRVVDTKVHDQAAVKLQHLGTASFNAMPDLLMALLDERWTVKLCVQSLLYEHPSAAFPPLVSVLEDGDDIALQIAAADVIREYGSGHYLVDTSPAIQALIRMSEGKQVAARVAAVKTLAVIGKGNAAAEKTLERCRADRNRRVRDACQV
ncbi:MAG TPA: HEAT repeat domain-containing protein, partial [Pirellulaceae bacterium]|nr:HEAT repeat domain-containing protein [Pirellulaceae bacterium]